MDTSKKNGADAVTKNGKAAEHEEEIQIEPIHIDAEALKRAKSLQSQESKQSPGERRKKSNNFREQRRQSSSTNGATTKQFSRQSSTNDRTNASSNGEAAAAHGSSSKDRRTSYTNSNRTKSSGNNKRSFDEKPGRVGGNNKSRSVSTQDGGGALEDKKRNRSSTASNGKLRNKSTNSNGESFDYDDYELEEPFSDSDEEEARGPQQKPSLVIPRGRIRTLSGTVPPTGFSPKWGGPTMCLSCLQFFDLPDLMETFSEHLLNEHQIVITEVELIVDLKRYVEHWRQRFAKQPINEIFPKVVPKEGDPLHGRVDYYFEMSERVQEDYLLRQRLAMRRLEEALACQQREREESNFSLACIFCRYVARGNRGKLIHHLYMIHHLNLGSPDNLVFVQEYIEYLRSKIVRHECIYCEKTFADRNVLMDHMRKRNHREVNPSNNYYDKFYIINYLELGKRWLEVLAEDFEDSMPTFADSDDEEEEESWHEWQEDNSEEQLCVVCLFCNNYQETVPALLSHMNDTHHFDFLKFIEDEKMGTYERVKFINFLRKKNFNTPNYRAAAKKEDEADEESKPVELPPRAEWDVDEELVPMFGNDHLLWLLESHLDELNGSALAELHADEADLSESARLQRQIEESKANTVPEVTAEELPVEKSESFLSKEDLYKTLL